MVSRTEGTFGNAPLPWGCLSFLLEARVTQLCFPEISGLGGSLRASCA